MPCSIIHKSLLLMGAGIYPAPKFDFFYTPLMVYQPRLEVLATRYVVFRECKSLLLRFSL